MVTETQRQRQKAETAQLPVVTQQDEKQQAVPIVDMVARPIAGWRPGTINTEVVPVSHLDEEPSTSNRRAVMPGVSDEAEAQINGSQGNGSLWKRVRSGLWTFLKRIVGRDLELPKVDPLSGKDHCFTRVEYVSRWGLVEFGVTCPKCEALAAAPGQFKRVWNTADGEAVTCPECKSTLLASPTTEKEEHLLPYSTKLHKFSRTRHQWSPYTSQQAAEIRETLPKRLAKDPMAVLTAEAAIELAEKGGSLEEPIAIELEAEEKSA